MKRLLLVDDDTVFLQLLSSRLQQDFQVYEATGVEEALKTLDTIPIYAICSDWNIKNGTGIKLLEGVSHGIKYRSFLCPVTTTADLLK